MKKLALVFVVTIISSCGGGFKKTPIDQMIKDMSNDEAFSIILYDMDAQGAIFKDYMHQYRIIRTNNGEVDEQTTEWMEVSEDFFRRHVDHLGMEIAAKSADGEITKNASPPGYSSYVGNSQYGQWVNRGGTSFWEFYGQYALLSSMFNMMSFPVSRSYYDDYRRDYQGRKPYFGPTSGGSRMYGTGSTYTKTTKPNTRWNNRSSSSFKDRVRKSVSRSDSRYSRSGGSSSYRARSGGFGK
ncbi:MAG: hypothetical protein ACOCXH_05160 [Cyclobacteriaceae bacterium]